MNENAALQQEFNFRLSLLRLVTNAPFQVESANAATNSTESNQIEKLYALVSTGNNNG